MSDYHRDELELSPSDTGYSSLGNFSQQDFETDNKSDQLESINSSIFELDDELSTNASLTCYGLPTELTYAHKEIIYLRKKLANIELTTFDLKRKLQALSLENECIKTRNYSLEKENKNLKIDLKTCEVDLSLKNASIASLKEEIIQQNCKIESISHKELISNCFIGSIQKELDIQKKSNEFYLKQIISLYEIKSSLEKKVLELETSFNSNISYKIDPNDTALEYRTEVVRKLDLSSLKKFKRKYFKLYKNELHTLRNLVCKNRKICNNYKRKLNSLHCQLFAWKRIIRDQNYSLDALRKSHDKIRKDCLDAVSKAKCFEQSLIVVKQDNNVLSLKLDASNRERFEVNETVNVLKNDFNKLVEKLSKNCKKNAMISKSTQSEITDSENLEDISNDNLQYILPKLRLEKTLIDEQLLLIDFFYKFIRLIVIDFDKANNFLSKLCTNDFSNFKDQLISDQQKQTVVDYQKATCKCKTIKHRIVLKKKYLFMKSMYQQILKILQNSNKRFKQNEEQLIHQLNSLEQKQLKYEKRFTEIANFIMILKSRYEIKDSYPYWKDKSSSEILNDIVFNKMEEILLGLFQNILQKIVDLRNYIKILRIEINSVSEDKVSHQKYGFNLKAVFECALIHNRKLLECVLQDLEKKNYICLNMIEIFKLNEIPSTAIINKFLNLHNNSLEDLKNTINDIKVSLESIESKIKTKCC